MLHALWLIPAFITGWVVCYIQMTYGVDQNGIWISTEEIDKYTRWIEKNNE